MMECLFQFTSDRASEPGRAPCDENCRIGSKGIQELENKKRRQLSAISRARLASLLSVSSASHSPVTLPLRLKRRPAIFHIERKLP